MENTYGYKPLSYELIKLFRSGAPDFSAAENLIHRGADVNDQGKDKKENVLSKILWGYWQTSTGDLEREECWDCERDLEWCKGCPISLNPNTSSAMIDVIRFFLAHGFDVNRNEGWCGTQCLDALHLSTFDRSMIQAIKILLDAGARDVSTEDALLEAYGTEQNYQDVCEHNHYLGSIYEAAYRILLAVREGRPYTGIDTFEAAIGKRILSIKADAKEEPVFTTVITETTQHENCFYCDLYLLFEEGFLVCEKEASYYFDTHLPEKQLIDISGRFPELIGQVIEDITFSHNEIVKRITHYGQPVTTLHLSNGKKLSFTINFGEQDRKHYCAYYYFS